MSCETAIDDRIEDARRGNVHALETLLEEYQGIIRSLAGRLHSQRESREELIQAGCMGLMQAIVHYDASRNVKLITYAVPWILGEMRKAIRYAETYSLDQPIQEKGLTLHDVLAGSLDVDVGQLDVRLAVSKLSPDEQNLILLRYYRDKTQNETAVLLGKSQAQISRLERRALDALQVMLR